MNVGISIWWSRIGCNDIHKNDILFSDTKVKSSLIFIYVMFLFFSCLRIFLKTKLKDFKNLRLSIVTINDILYFTLLGKWFVFLIVTYGDIEKNPGPVNSFFKIMHWNLNSLTAHNFSRVNIIESFNTINEYDIIALPETAYLTVYQMGIFTSMDIHLYVVI